MRHVDLARQWPRAQLPTFTAASLATTSNISNKSLEISPGQPTYQAKKGQIRHTNIRWERKVAQRIPREGGNVKIICRFPTKSSKSSSKASSLNLSKPQSLTKEEKTSQSIFQGEA